MIKPGSIVQITNEKNEWFPSLIIVTEIKSFGIQGYVHLPLKGDAFIRLKKEDYEYIGEAIIVRDNA